LPGAFFDLSRKGITVARDQIKAYFGTKVLFGSFVEGNVFLGIGSMKVVERIR
jgi:hypothetical protein